MPQGRRKTPFSGKAKKEQMKAKKQRHVPGHHRDSSDDEKSELGDSLKVQKINKQPKDATGRNRYALQFFQESRAELQQRKEEARMSIEPIPLEEQEVADDYFPQGLDLPKRPPWDYSMSKEQLDSREQRYFREYIKNIEELGKASYFELNLETWRQLWRVLEMSDVLLMIVDIRYPVLMFPPYLYKYITQDLGKEMILVLNKIDLAPPALVIAWREYFKTHYPQLRIVFFTSYPTYNLRGNTEDGEGLKKRRRRGKMRMAAEGAQKLLETCREIVGDAVDLTSWQEKIQEEMQLEYDFEDVEREGEVLLQKSDTSYFKHEKYKNGVLTIGCIGTPNVGKSSFMNAVMGRKVVSVSRTPGHTKHFQTIFLTKTVCLCDCPGLVFPSTVPRQLQILMGSFPIAQVREPYTTVKYLGQRLNLPKLLKIQHPENDDSWSAIDICDGWASKRNFRTARTARLDTYRAANSLLRMALEGKICCFVFPIGWAKDKGKWEAHEDIEMIRWIQASSAAPEVADEIEWSSEEEVEQVKPSTKGKKETGDSEASEEDEESEEENALATANKFTALDAE